MGRIVFLVGLANSPSLSSVFAQSVYPSASRVPANLLRISVVFPSPQDVAVARRLELVDGSGRRRAGSLYPQPLWSPDRTVLTIYLDPGRVKTGTDLHSSVGPVLRPGEVVGLSLAGRILRSWRVVAGRERSLRLASGPVVPPRAGTCEPLSVRFGSPIDWHGRELVGVEDPSGRRLSGHVELSDGETIWSLRPERPWRSGEYALRFHPSLEDPEGNRIGRPFEVQVGGARGPDADVRRTFIVRRGPLGPLQHRVASPTEAPALDNDEGVDRRACLGRGEAGRRTRPPSVDIQDRF